MPDGQNLPAAQTARILSIADDPGLRDTRDMILRRAGYEVVSTSAREFLRMAPDPSFVLAVVCHGVTADDARIVAERLRAANENVHLIRLRLNSTPPTHDAYEEFPWVYSPELLLERVEQLIKKRNPSQVN